LERFRSEQDSRRHWRRVPIRLTMHCKRLGRGDDAMVVETMDMSPGGVRLRAPDRLMTGDVVLCWTQSDDGEAATGIKGLVVQSRNQHDRTSEVHVAWTNLSPESGEEIGRLLTLHDPGPAAPVEPV
jgi:hypothetical protein